MDRFTGWPLTWMRFFPPRETLRRITSSSAMSIPIPAIRLARSPLSATWKTASTTASSAEVRIISEEARSPRRRLRAPTMMDFPAPVSPDRTFRPG